MPSAGDCSSYRLVIETATITVPSATVLSEDCDVPASCCTTDTTSFSAYLCESEVLTEYETVCDTTWVSDDTTGLDADVFLQTEQVTIRLPAGSVITGTTCHTLDCDETVGLDCECA